MIDRLDRIDGLDSLRALTVWQPWASLIVAGVKRIENRTWGTNYRGLILIHAAARPVDRKALDRLAQLGIDVPDDLPRGAIVGAVELVDVVRLGQRSLFDDVSNDDPFASGPLCWKLANARQLATPIPWDGRQGFWSVPLGQTGPLRFRDAA